MNVLLIASLFAVCGAASLPRNLFFPHRAIQRAVSGYAGPSAYTPSHQYSTQDEIVFLEQTQDSIGNYEFSYETSNGIIVQERGIVRNAGTAEQYIEVSGFYSYIDSYDGKEYSVFYIADKDGFRAEGDHLPGASTISGDMKKAFNFKAAPQKGNTRTAAADSTERHHTSMQPRITIFPVKVETREQLWKPTATRIQIPKVINSKV